MKSEIVMEKVSLKIIPLKIKGDEVGFRRSHSLYIACTSLYPDRMADLSFL